MAAPPAGLLLLADAEGYEVPLVGVVDESCGERSAGVQADQVGTCRPGGDVVEVGARCSAGAGSGGEDRRRHDGRRGDEIDEPVGKQFVVGGVEDVEVGGQRRATAGADELLEVDEIDFGPVVDVDLR